ncbi:MAG TPA: HPF/RaiA family ribosome-associated protein [bacterium]|nr:HPF/RaiA family ribosome-associated protein [bacterium]
MQIQFRAKDVVLTDKNRSYIERRIRKLKHYIHDEPVMVDVYLTDESSKEKGGDDQSVEIAAMIKGKKLFVHETDPEIMVAFAKAYEGFDRKIKEIHARRIDRSQKPRDGRIERLLKRFGLRK